MRVSASISAKIGVAPESTIKLTVETQVMEGVITSSPGPIFRALRARCIPAVAEDKATACFAPQYSLKASSNSAAFDPVVIHPERRTSETAEISFSEIEGFEKGKNLLRIIIFSIFYYLKIITVENEEKMKIVGKVYFFYVFKKININKLK
jgi:hypothetical protein